MNTPPPKFQHIAEAAADFITDYTLFVNPLPNNGFFLKTNNETMPVHGGAKKRKQRKGAMPPATEGYSAMTEPVRSSSIGGCIGGDGIDRKNLRRSRSWIFVLLLMYLFIYI